MSKKGGYKIIDFKGLTLSTTDVVIPGIYDAIESTTKPILASGIKISTTEYNDEFVGVTISSDDFVIDFHGYDIVITVDDEVSATAQE